jgi:hypothetical protein
MKKITITLGIIVVVGIGTCLAGWLNPTQQGFVIQTFTTYEPMSGNNSGTIVTNGNSYQFAGDNTGWMWIGGPGSQFRGKNDGQMVLNGDGAFILGSFGSLSSVTNRGKGSLLLGNLSGGQKAVITDVGNAAILLGAGTVSNSQSIVVGDDLGSHGTKSVTAGAFWAMGDGFFGNASGLTGIPLPFGYGVTEETTALGREANGSESGTAIGLIADGSSYGVAVGQEAIGSSCGAAVGYSADGTAGAAIGYGSLGAYGAAVGTFSCGSAYGAAVGVSASGYSYGVGIGAYAVGNGLGNVALGGGEEGGLVAAIPSGFTDTVELGRGTAVSNGWLHFHGHPVVDANGGIYPGAIKGFVSTNDTRYRATVTNGASPSFQTVTATNFSLGAVGKFMILGGTQLVFVAGSVTNVLDPDVGKP